jgi:hypothetical protein
MRLSLLGGVFIAGTVFIFIQLGYLPFWSIIAVAPVIILPLIFENRAMDLIKYIVVFMIVALMLPIALTQVMQVANTNYVTTTDNFGQTVTLTETNTTAVANPLTAIFGNSTTSFNTGITTAFEILLPVLVIAMVAFGFLRIIGEDWHDEYGNTTYRARAYQIQDVYTLENSRNNNEASAFENEILEMDRKFRENA